MFPLGLKLNLLHCSTFPSIPSTDPEALFSILNMLSSMKVKSLYFTRAFMFVFVKGGKDLVLHLAQFLYQFMSKNDRMCISQSFQVRILFHFFPLKPKLWSHAGLQVGFVPHCHWQNLLETRITSLALAINKPWALRYILYSYILYTAINWLI